MTCEASISRRIGRKGMTARCWIPLSVLGCAFLFLLATMDRSLNLFDEGLILVGSTRVMSGDIPYRDFYSIYGPGQFYVLAALFKIFGPSVLVERLWDLLMRSCTVLVVYLIVDGPWNRVIALFTALLTSIWLSNFRFYGYPVFPCLLFSLLSLYCLIPIYRGRRATIPLLASGICVGITIVFRHDVGVATAIGGAFAFGLFYTTQKLEAPRKISALLSSVMLYVGGIALVVVPVLVLLFAAGAAHDMLLDLVVIPARIYVRMRSLPFPSVAAIARDVMHLKVLSLDQLAVYLPIIAVLLGVIATLAPGRNLRSATSVDEQAFNSQRRWILLQLSALSLLFFFKGWVRVSLLHMALSIVPSLMIMTIWGFELRSRAAKILFRVGIVCLLSVSWPPTLSSLARFADNLAWAYGIAPLNRSFDFARSGNGSCFPPPGLERLQCFYMPRQQQEAILYIQEHTAENERIFVGLTRHDKIFVNNILFYFLSKRPPVTKWHEFDPGVQTTIEIQSEMVGELQTRRPQYVVLSSQWDNVEEPNDSARSSGVTVLDQYIRTNYHEVAAFDPISILERRPD